MEKPRIRHTALNVADREKNAEYYKKVFGMEEKYRGPSGTIYLSDGHFDLALISTDKYPWGIHHFGFKVDSVPESETICGGSPSSLMVWCRIDQREGLAG